MDEISGLFFKTRSRTTAKEEAGARWRKLALERGKQRLTDSTLETGGRRPNDDIDHFVGAALYLSECIWLCF